MKNIFTFIPGKTISALRERKPLTQNDLADRVGVSRQTIITWEGKEKAKVSQSDAEKLALALGVTIEVLTKEKTDSEYGPSVKEDFSYEMFQEIKKNNQVFKEEIDRLWALVNRLTTSDANPSHANKG